MTATKTFSRAIKVRRSNTGCYEFTGVLDMEFAAAISYGRFTWEVVEPLTGWDEWTHAIRVTYGDQEVYYFVR